MLVLDATVQIESLWFDALLIFSFKNKFHHYKFPVPFPIHSISHIPFLLHHSTLAIVYVNDS